MSLHLIVKCQKGRRIMNLANRTHVDFFNQVSLFKGLTEEEIIQLAGIAKMESYFRSDRIFDIHQKSDKIYFLVEGSVKIANQSDYGREVIQRIIQPGSMFGELSLFGNAYRKDFAIVLSKEAVVFSIPLVPFKNILRRNTHFSMMLLNLVGERLKQTENRLEALVFKDARERIIDFLKESANNQGKKVGFELLIKHSLTQQDIANFTGTSRQTVTAVFNELRKSNLIYFTRKSILIRDLAKLA